MPMIKRQGQHLLEEVVEEKRKDKGKARKRLVMPYNHGHGHRFKKVVDDDQFQLTFSYPYKFSSLPHRVNAERKCKCNKAKHFVSCSSSVVYEVPLSCGKSYIGQTGSCINTRLMQHEYNISKKKQDESLLVKHVMSCSGCEALLQSTKVLI